MSGMAHRIQPSIRVGICQNDSSNIVFGPGIAALCRGVMESGSLNKAAKSMGMAYSKAWRIMKESEEGLGFQLLNRDGARGSTLTEEGVRLLEAYDKLGDDVNAYAKKRLNELLK
jgi:molybdate transport system regulatory protein